MKKLTYLFLALLIVACSSDDANNPNSLEVSWQVTVEGQTYENSSPLMYLCSLLGLSVKANISAVKGITMVLLEVAVASKAVWVYNHSFSSVLMLSALLLSSVVQASTRSAKNK